MEYGAVEISSSTVSSRHKCQHVQRDHVSFSIPKSQHFNEAVHSLWLCDDMSQGSFTQNATGRVGLWWWWWWWWGWWWRSLYRVCHCCFVVAVSLSHDVGCLTVSFVSYYWLLWLTHIHTETHTHTKCTLGGNYKLLYYCLWVEQRRNCVSEVGNEMWRTFSFLLLWHRHISSWRKSRLYLGMKNIKHQCSQIKALSWTVSTAVTGTVCLSVLTVIVGSTALPQLCC